MVLGDKLDRESNPTSNERVYVRVQRLDLLRVGLFGNHPFILYSTPSAPLFLIPGSSCTSYLLSGSCISVELLSHIAIYAAATNRVAQGIVLVESSVSRGKSSLPATHITVVYIGGPPFSPPGPKIHTRTCWQYKI